MLELLTERVDVIDSKGQVTKVSSDAVGFFLIPVVGQLNLWLSLGGREKDQRKASLGDVFATGLDETQLVDEKIERSVNIFDADHCV